MSTTVRGSALPTTITDLGVLETDHLGVLDAAITQDRANIATNASGIATAQSELNAARSGAANLDARLDANMTTLTNALLSESGARAAGDSTTRAQFTAADSALSLAQAGEIARVDARLDAENTYATVLHATLPTTLLAVATAGATSVSVAAAGRFADKQSITIVNAALGQIHTTTVNGIPTGSTIPLATPIPASWTGANVGAIGDAVGSSPPEIERARTPTFAPVGYSGNVPERITIIEQKIIYARAFRAYTANEGAALNAAMAVAPVGYTVKPESGEYIIPQLDRAFVLSGRKLDMPRGYVLRPQVWSTTTTAVANPTATFIKVANQQATPSGTGIYIALTNGARHFARITGYSSTDQWNIQPALPASAGAASGAAVGTSWAGLGGQAQGLVNVLGQTDFEIEGGFIDGMRGSLPHGRMYGIDVRGSSNGRIDGVHIENMASNKVDNFNNWGLEGDGILLSYMPGYTGGVGAPGCRNIRINDIDIRNCDRSGIAVVRCDGAYIDGGTIVNVKPTNASVGNLGVGVVFEDDSTTGRRNTGWVKNLDISECYSGLQTVGKATLASPTYASGEVLLENNRIRGSVGFPILLQGIGSKAIRNTIFLGRFHGIGVYTADQWEVSHNTILADGSVDTRNGIYVGGSSNGKIHNNTVQDTYSAAIMLDQTFAHSGVYDVFNISIKENVAIDCVTPGNTGGVVAPITLQAGIANSVQTSLTRITVKDNLVVDTRTGGGNVSYAIDALLVLASQKSTWRVEMGPGQGIAVAGIRGMVVENRTLRARQALAFGVSTNGISTATSTVIVPGAEVGDEIEVTPPGAFPANFGKPQGYVSMADTVVVIYPQMGGTAATPTGGSFLVRVTKIT